MNLILVVQLWVAVHGAECASRKLKDQTNTKMNAYDFGSSKISLAPPYQR